MGVSLDDEVHFDVITSNPSTGAAVDADAAPSFAIFEQDNDTAILSGNFTKRTGLTGNYRASATLSTANGFEVGKWYNVVASATVGSVVGKAVVKTFEVVNPPGSAGGLSVVGSEMGVNAAGASAIVSAIQSADIPLVRYSNVDAEGRIFVTQNADHYATDGFGLEITVEGFDGDLSNAASAVLTIASGGVTEPFTMTGAPSTGSGTGSARYTFNFDLPRSQMANLEKGTGTYDLFAVLANGHQISVLVEQQARIYGRL